MKVDSRFLTSQGPEIFTGNELLVKGALEAQGGMHLLGGYPGSPVAGFFDALSQIKDLLTEKGIRAVINNNEALSGAMLNGSQLLGCRAMIVMKSVGVHVAADALALGNLAGAHPDGGAILVCGDDPWSDSTQVPADSRYICKHLHMPVIEPATAQDVKDYVDLSLRVSREAELYAGYLITTNLADGGGTVQCRPNQFPTFSTRQQLAMKTDEINLNKYVLLPPRTWWQEASLPARFARAMATARRTGMNQLLFGGGGKKKPLGFVASGLAFSYLQQALGEMDLLGEFPIVKFGLSYPIDPQMVRELAQQCDRIIVVEERRGFMEEQIGQVILRDRQEGADTGNVELWGKKFPGNLPGFPERLGLHPSLVIETLGRLMDHLAKRGQLGSSGEASSKREVESIQATGRAEFGATPPRLPSFCPGCPHRDSASLCLEIKKSFADELYMRRMHKRGAVDLVFHGDTGCYTMLMFPPNTPLMHNYSGMGLGAGTGSGIDPFVTNKQVVFMGDSTFFHSGQIGISQAIKLGQDITFIILDNRTTAMTGHQPTPGVDYDILGNSTAAQSIDDIVRGMSIDGTLPVVRVSPERRTEYRRLLEQTFLSDGVKIIIADKECGITRTRRRRRAERQVIRNTGFLPAWEHMNVNQDICNFCLDCSRLTGCPGLKHVQTDYGLKTDTDLTWCVNDGACERIGSCSAFEHVTIKRKAAPRSRVPELNLDAIPEPALPPMPESGLWRCCLVGVGGMGIGLATQVLVRAGHKQGLEVTFYDKKGLAIRNGGTISHVTYASGSTKPVTAVIPFGKADLLLGMDVLEAARAVDPESRSRIASPERTAAVINTDKISTISGLINGRDFDVEGLDQVIRRHTRPNETFTRNIGRLCEKYLGNKLYTNIMLLGLAFQKGLIPVSLHSMAWAIKDTIKADFRKNMYAFNIGRKLMVEPALFQGPPKRTGWRETLEDKCRHTIRRYGRGQVMAESLRQMAAEVVGRMDTLDESVKRDVIVRLYDCMRWGGLEYARRYADAIASVHEQETRGIVTCGLEQYGAKLPATRAVIDNLAKAMLIKDIVFIAELATSPEKYARDREKYNVNPPSGDRIVYRHLLHPDIHLFGKTFRPSLIAPHWVMQLAKRMTFLRKGRNWRRREREFLALYEQRIANFHFGSVEQYHQAVARLSEPQCMQCLTPHCQDQGCPLHSEIDGWMELARQGKWKEASDLLHKYNNFPEFTAYICPAACESACRQALSGYPVRIQKVEREIIERAWQDGFVQPQRPTEKTGKKVAVIGSGPAGLAAAQQLVRRGHQVVVYEKDSQPGGLLRYGVPEFRLPKKMLDRRLEQMISEGVNFEVGLAIGKDTPLGELRKQYDAVLLAGGAARPRDLRVAGRENSSAVQYAMDFLRQANLAVAGKTDAKTTSAAGRTVAVIGGGETGNDCVEMALSQGAKKVYQLEIMPASNGQAASDLEGRIERRWCVATTQIHSNGQGVRLSGVQVRWLFTAAGRQHVQTPGTEFELSADLVLLALGFDAPADPAMVEQLGLKTDEAGRLVVNEFSTSAAGVFVAGDLASGASLVAKAIDSGRRAAEHVDQFLRRA